MKTLTLTSVLICISITLCAQISLNYQSNALIAGDSFAFREIQFSDPGSAGAKQIWDFSAIQYTGKNPVGSLLDTPMQKSSGAGDYNLLLNENGYDYFMNSTQNKLEELGYINNELKISLNYSDPVVKMIYPFAYGAQFTDHFIGVALVNETSRIDFFGDCNVVADGYGTLILPDQVFENALRVKSIKKGLQINMCGTTDINIVKYSWYVLGYRYPVLSLSIIENSYNGAAPLITKSAFTNTQQQNERSAIVMSKTAGSQLKKSDITVFLSPNPFSNQLTYTYFLDNQITASIELYDTSGKHIGWLARNQQQTQGLHTGELNASTFGLTPGVYFIRFTFDQQVVIRKVVKI